MYYRWLERAWLGGLRLQVMLAVNNAVLCSLVKQKSGYGCEDMPSVDRQIDAAFAMQTFIDDQNGGAGKGWYRIVTTPKQARDVVAADINTHGFAHIGLLPDFIEELKVVGLSKDQLRPLFSSAEAYVQVWERSEAADLSQRRTQRPPAVSRFALNGDATDLKGRATGTLSGALAAKNRFTDAGRHHRWSR